MGCAATKHPKCDKREQATSTPLTPLASWLQTSPLLTSLAPKCPQISNNWCNKQYYLYYVQLNTWLFHNCLLVARSQLPNVFVEKCSHCLISMTPTPSEMRWELSLPGWCFRCSASGCCLQLFPLAIQQAQQRNDLCQEQGCLSGFKWCIALMEARHSAR